MRYLLFALTVILGLTSNLLAQEKGGISGKIVDKMNQQPVIGAVIEVVGAGLKSGSDDNGYYYLETVPTGRYSLRFTSIGYQLFVVTTSN